MKEETSLREEGERLRRLRLLVDVTAQVLSEAEKLTVCEALRLVDAARPAALRLFPARRATFALVIRPRLDRIILERFQLPSPNPVN